MPAKSKKRKHVPQRTCVGCRKVIPKRSLIRIVRSPEGVMVDLTGKMAGRGAYLHDNQSCWEKGIDGALEKALRTELTALEIVVLEEYSQKLQSVSLDDAKHGEE